jgi:hypothetical protein
MLINSKEDKFIKIKQGSIFFYIKMWKYNFMSQVLVAILMHLNKT